AETQAKPGQDAALRDVLKACVAPTRAEQGNRGYALHEGLDTPGRFFLYETWTSRDALKQRPDSRFSHSTNTDEVFGTHSWTKNQRSVFASLGRLFTLRRKSPCAAKQSTAAGALHSPPQVGSSP